MLRINKQSYNHAIITRNTQTYDLVCTDLHNKRKCIDMIKLNHVTFKKIFNNVVR